MAAGGGEGGATLEFTPTWVVAIVCSFMVMVSLAIERFLHFLGKTFKHNNQKPLYEALLKVKEELMLLGFISLLLVVLQGSITEKICLPPSFMNHMLPCKKEDAPVGVPAASAAADAGGAAAETAATFPSPFFTGFPTVDGVRRRLLAVEGGGSGNCASQGKVPLLSLAAIHQLHIFIFVLAITHVVFCVLTMVLGSLKITRWKHWEDSIQQDNSQAEIHVVTHVRQLSFIKERFKGIGKDSSIIRWLHSFGKQFHGSVTKADYATMRMGFITTHCRGNPKFNFHKYMMRALEADFKKVVGISWYLWVFVVVFMLLNVHGWQSYFWLAFIPLILLLAVGTKLEHVISELAHEVAEKHVVLEGQLIVNPSDDHFWFHRPRIILFLIHFILFQNAFEIAFFFWILTTYGFDSCIMGKVGFIVPRLVIGVLIQLLCSYSTLPLYAIVTQMGSSFKKAIFDEHIQEGLVGWAHKIKHRKATNPGSGTTKPKETAGEVLLQNMAGQVDNLEEGSGRP